MVLQIRMNHGNKIIFFIKVMVVVLSLCQQGVFGFSFFHFPPAELRKQEKPELWNRSIIGNTNPPSFHQKSLYSL